MQKRWSVNSMMLTFAAFSVVLIVWVLWAFKMGFGTPTDLGSGFFSNFLGKPGDVLNPSQLQGRANIPLLSGAMPSFRFPKSSLVYFQFVFAAITPILMLGRCWGASTSRRGFRSSRCGSTFVYTVDAFLLWGGGLLRPQGRDRLLRWLRDPPLGRHLRVRRRGRDRASAPARPGDRRAEQRRDGRGRRRTAVARLERLQRRGPLLRRDNSAAAAVLNTNLCTAVALMIWVAWDYITGRKP